MMIKVTLKGDVREFDAGISVADVAKSIGAGLYKSACAAKVNGNVCDLRTVLDSDCEVEILTFDDVDGKKAFWHTTSHILAQAVKRLYPAAKLSIGPSIDSGFYYDFDVEKPFTAEDLEAIEKEMKAIVKSGVEISRFELAPAEAVRLLEEMAEPYKVELCNEHVDKGENISFYKQAEFTDLCAGPHLMSVAPVKAFRLTNCTGAYWRGDSKNKMLCRVYGVSFPKAAQLEEHLTMLEEAKKRDHRKLGKELEIFTLMEEGPGFPFFLPKGMIVKNELINYWREIHRAAGYDEIQTPIMLSRHLWETSGHWYHYKENMYTTVIDDEDFAIKPMNCPGGILVYKMKMHSYRDLPLRMGELGLVHRHELSGALHGLMRVRNFTQDDAHIFMTQDQIKDEIKDVVKLIDYLAQGNVSGTYDKATRDAVSQFQKANLLDVTGVVDKDTYELIFDSSAVAPTTRTTDLPTTTQAETKPTQAETTPASSLTEETKATEPTKATSSEKETSSSNEEKNDKDESGAPKKRMKP